MATIAISCFKSAEFYVNGITVSLTMVIFAENVVGGVLDQTGRSNIGVVIYAAVSVTGHWLLRTGNPV